MQAHGAGTEAGREQFGTRCVGAVTSSQSARRSEIFLFTLCAAVDRPESGP